MLAPRHLGYEEHLWAHHQPSLIWRLSKQVTAQLRQRGRVRGGIRFGVGSLAHLLKKLLSFAQFEREVIGRSLVLRIVGIRFPVTRLRFPDRPQIFPA